MSQVRVLSPRLTHGGCMDKNERGDLSVWAFLFIVMVFLAVAIYNSPKNQEMGLQGGDIDRAIREQQYR